jgi:multiple sugar transport system substrate-binding protein
MSQFKRRDFLKTSAGAGAALGASASIIAPAVQAAAPVWNVQPEKGAKLRVLRWSRFVQGDIDQYMKNVKKFEDKYGIQVRVDNESWEDVRPKAAVAANTGAGPDIILGTNDDADLYPEKLLDVTDLANYLGKKYGGWYAAGQAYLRPDGKRWIGIPLGAAGSMMVYRESQLKAAGFDSFPKDTDGFLKMMKALKDKGTPGGFALGHATGDANTWCHWLVWAFGGKMVDKSGKVVLDSPETVKALEYSKELYGTFVPGTLSWLDPSNNKVFLDGQISVTNNGISIYYAAKTSKDPKINALAADINHATYPVGPSGSGAAFHLFLNQMIFKYTKYPKAAKEFIRFMMEEEQFGPWMEASIGYVAHPLAAYAKNPIWTVDPKHLPYRDAVKELRPAGYDGKLGYASAGALADFIIVDMVAEAASGSKSPKEAAERAQKRAERYYKV